MKKIFNKIFGVFKTHLKWLWYSNTTLSYILLILYCFVITIAYMLFAFRNCPDI